MEEKIVEDKAAGKNRKPIELKLAQDPANAEFRFEELLFERINKDSGNRGRPGKKKEPENPLPAEWIEIGAEKLATWKIGEEQILEIDPRRCGKRDGKIWADLSLCDEIEKACEGKPPEMNFYYTPQELKRERPRFAGDKFLNEKGSSMNVIVRITGLIKTYQKNEEEARRQVPLELRILVIGKRIFVPWKIAQEIMKPQRRATIAAMFTGEALEEGVPENIGEIVKAYNSGISWARMEKKFGMSESTLAGYLEEAAEKGAELKFRCPQGKRLFEKI
ncbi:Uncharacterised protein [Candidatus Gugararchaeum adminiculabundum]|nr:Uncharacterised protein [Candidatus Gugararchaeum adminiculabundum]